MHAVLQVRIARFDWLAERGAGLPDRALLCGRDERYMTGG
jgi:hypothetical protein